MKKMARLPFVAVLVAVGFCGVTSADESGSLARSIYPLQALTCPEALLRGCCDKYCPKPQPCLPCFCHGCAKDDYCCKPCPCILNYHGGCAADCYCRKPCPELCRPLFSDYSTCAGYGVGCTGMGTNPYTATPPALSEAAKDPIEGRDNSSVSSASLQQLQP
jgi:hypothetical protein